MAYTRKSQQTKHVTDQGKHRFEHWYRDNQIYFITARCRERFPAFREAAAKAVFWNRFEHYTRMHGFTPIVTSLLDNHYHTLGHLRRGDRLGEMMRKLHGSVAKLVNDTLDERRVPFWHDRLHHDYFDGCLRDEKQFRLTYHYVCIQSVRHRYVEDWQLYPHTRVDRELEESLSRALELGALLKGVPYKRYQQGRGT